VTVAPAARQTSLPPPLSSSSTSCASASAGQRQLAIRQYDYCRDLLASELDISPMPETEALHQQILGANGGADGGSGAALDLTDGQSRLLAVLQAVSDELEQARRRLDEARALIARFGRIDAAPAKPGQR
jgi:hypothetical protein